MAFAINQNFDLKSKRKDFVRQELTLEQLKITRDADYPDDYQVVIGGKIYIFNSKNAVDPTLGKWKEFKSGTEVTAGAGLTMDAGGTMSVKVPSQVTDGIYPGLEVDDKGLRVKVGPGLMIADDGLRVELGSGLCYDSRNRISIPMGTGLKLDSDGVMYVPGGGSDGLTLGSGLEYDTLGRVQMKVGTGLGFLVDGGVGVQLGSGLTYDEYYRIAVTSESSSITISTQNQFGIRSDQGRYAINLGTGIFTSTSYLHTKGLTFYYDRPISVHGSGLNGEYLGITLEVDDINTAEITAGTSAANHYHTGMCFRDSALSIKLVEESKCADGPSAFGRMGKSGLKLTSNGLDIDIPTLAAALIPHLPFK